jgi:serine/threonine protein kinase
MSYKYGITGFVKINNNIAKKYIELTDFYWIKEYSNLIYLWPFITNNIIKYEMVSFVKAKDPKDNEEKTYCEITFPRYKNILSDVKICKDSDIIQIILDILSAVKLLHEHKIIHRDIKPNNILLNDNRAVLIDFSHSIRIRAENIKLDKQVATYSHRAPEIFKYKKNLIDTYDEKIDIWSVGIILIELITGLSFYNNITTGTYDDIEFLLKDSSCISTINEYVKNKKLKFKYNHMYCKWIEKMLSYDPNNRITAKQMYYEIFKFALSKSICITIPTNENFIKNNYYKKIELKNKYEYLYILCVEAAKRYIKLFNLCTPVTSLYSIIQLLLNKKAIQYNNYHNMVLSLLFISDTVIYDNTININNYGFKKNKIDEILKDIIYIICNFDRELFMNNLFTFDKQIIHPNEKNNSIHSLLPLSDSKLYINNSY